MKVVNIFGAPNSGKSVTASDIFSALKKRHMNIELVTEFAKVLSWSDHKVALRDQLYIFAKQHHRIEILRGKADIVVTDSPLLVSLQFIPEEYFASFKPLVFEVFNSFDNLNFFHPGIQKYSAAGRHHSKEECIELSGTVEELLTSNNIPHLSVDPATPGALDFMLEKIITWSKK